MKSLKELFFSEQFSIQGDFLMWCGTQRSLVFYNEPKWPQFIISITQQLYLLSQVNTN